MARDMVKAASAVAPTIRKGKPRRGGLGAQSLDAGTGRDEGTGDSERTMLHRV